MENIKSFEEFHNIKESKVDEAWLPASDETVAMLNKVMKDSFDEPVEFEGSLMVKLQNATVYGGKHIEKIMKAGKFKDYAIHLFNGQCTITFNK